MLHKGLSQLVTMVVFFCLVVFIISENRPPPPPPKKKNTPSGVRKVEILAVCISEVIQVADLILHQHHSCPLIIQMHTRTNICYASLKDVRAKIF